MSGHGHAGDPRAVEVLLRRIDAGVPLPRYAHPGDAGADLVTTEDVRLEPGQRAKVGTGIAVALPDGYAAFVHPRSGLADRHGVGIVNAPGTVDAGYRGEIMVVLVNHDRQHPVELCRGERIAQLVVQRVERARFVVVDTLPGSARGTGGYGSTGTASPGQAPPPDATHDHPPTSPIRGPDQAAAPPSDDGTHHRAGKEATHVPPTRQGH